MAAAQHGIKVPPPGAAKPAVPHSHHRPPVDPKLKQPHSRPSSSHPPPRDILREAARDSPFGIATKDFTAPRDQKNEKDVPKSRDYLLKPNVAVETNNYNNYNGDKPNRPPSRIDPNKVPVKHEQVRRHDEKPFVKPDSEVKRAHSVPGHDRNSAYLNKSMNSTSQKVKSPLDTSKSVLKPPPQQPPPVKQHHHNGSSAHSAPIKEEVKEEPNPVKKPSLFSPEKSPKQEKPTTEGLSFPVLSPLESPNKRARNYSTGSEPELRPVMKKIDQVEGFENLMRDSTIGINKLHQIPDIITPITDIKEEPTLSFSKEMKPPDIIPPLCSDNNISTSQPLVNGIETNPTLISSLLKETPSVPHLPVVANTVPKTEPPQPEIKEKEHHHKSKKKNKEKHKHKDKDKSKEDKEKKKKHKDKDRDKHKHKSTIPEPAEPIKIKIQKDKIQQIPTPIKIKIPKDVIKTEECPPPAPTGLKIKIPRDIINNCNTEIEKSRKRERERGDGDGPPPKMSRIGGHKDSKQNGRHSYNKVSEYSKSSAVAAVQQPPPPPSTYHNMPMYPQNMYFYPHMGVGQAYIYPDSQMYNYYNGGYGYPPEMYQQPIAGANPPLPMDAPPDIPPPPPPE